MKWGCDRRSCERCYNTPRSSGSSMYKDQPLLRMAWPNHYKVNNSWDIGKWGIYDLEMSLEKRRRLPAWRLGKRARRMTGRPFPMDFVVGVSRCFWGAIRKLDVFLWSQQRDICWSMKDGWDQKTGKKTATRRRRAQQNQGRTKTPQGKELERHSWRRNRHVHPLFWEMWSCRSRRKRPELTSL